MPKVSEQAEPTQQASIGIRRRTAKKDRGRFSVFGEKVLISPIIKRFSQLSIAKSAKDTEPSPVLRALEQAGMAYYHTINTSNRMNNQINGVAPKYWGVFKELALGTLNYGWNQMSNEILYWTGN